LLVHEEDTICNWEAFKKSHCGSEYEEEEYLGTCSLFRNGNYVKGNVKRMKKS